MGLPTGVELKTAEPAVKTEEAVVANTVEEQKPVVTPVETSTAVTGATNAESTEAVEVCVCVNKQHLGFFLYGSIFQFYPPSLFHIRLLASKDQS